MSYLAGSWRIAGMLQRVSRKGSLVLLTQCAEAIGGTWGAIAVETHSPPEDAGIREQIDAVFEHHAHKNLGAFPSLGAAMRACETFAKEWGRAPERGAIVDACPCDEVKKETTP